MNEWKLMNRQTRISYFVRALGFLNISWIFNSISQIVYESLMALATPRLLRMSGIIACPVLKNTVRNLKKYSTDKIKNSSTEPQADLREAKGQSL